MADEKVDDEARITSFEGTWIGEEHGQVITIKGGKVDFVTTKGCPLLVDNGKIKLVFNSTTYELLSQSGDSLSWSDGDVWVRKEAMEKRCKEVTVASLDGHWVGKIHEQRIEIRDGSVSFDKTKGCPLKKSEDGLELVYRDNVYKVSVISNNGTRIVWSDGDIWQRTFMEEKDLKKINLIVQYKLADSTAKEAKLEVNPKSSVRDLKDGILAEVNKHEEVSDSQLHLIHAGTRLGENLATLQGCNMREGSKVIVIISRSGK